MTVNVAKIRNNKIGHDINSGTEGDVVVNAGEGDVKGCCVGGEVVRLFAGVAVGIDCAKDIWTEEEASETVRVPFE